jgi:hypothetical protein
VPEVFYIINLTGRNIFIQLAVFQLLFFKDALKLIVCTALNGGLAYNKELEIV